tara:strand:- start:1322 stop:2014 length:693 start_codon:yes stop_codon:yes gene_type:complete
MECGDLYVEEDVSAFSQELKKRPVGKRLWDAVNVGDVIVVTNQDRLFRDSLDALSSFRTWKKLDVSLFDMSKGRALDTDDDQTMFELMAVLSSSESRKQGRRRSDVNKTALKHGDCYSFTCPWGWNRYQDDGRFKYKKNEQERSLAKEALAMRKMGMSFPDIAYKWYKKGYQKQVRGGTLKYYTRQDVRSLCLALSKKFPKIPRATWKSSLLLKKLSGVVCCEPPLTSVE